MLASMTKMLEQAGGRRPGAYKLLPYIREHYHSIPAFCEAHGLDRQRVQNAIHGKTRYLDVDFSAGIEKATKGYIVHADWLEVGTENEAAAVAQKSGRPVRGGRAVVG